MISVAIWGRDKVVTAVTVAIWSANIAMAFWSGFPRFLFFSVSAHCSDIHIDPGSTQVRAPFYGSRRQMMPRY